MFLDSSGRRLRRTRIAGLITVTGVVAYLGLVGSAFLGAPNIIGPLLPEAIVSQKRPVPHASVVPTSPPTSESPSEPAPRSSTPDEPAPAPTSEPTPVSTVAPVQPEPQSPSTSPTTEPGRSATAPGKAKQPVP